MLVPTICGLAHARSSTSKFAFSIQIIDQQAQWKARTPVEVSVRFTNAKGNDINFGAASFVYGGVDSRFRYECRNQAGISVSKDCPILSSMGDRPQVVLKPGESHTENVNVATACDLTKPGEYQIQLSRTVPGDPKNAVVKSNIVTVTITP